MGSSLPTLSIDISLSLHPVYCYKILYGCLYPSFTTLKSLGGGGISKHRNIRGRICLYLKILFGRGIYSRIVGFLFEMEL